MLHLKFAEPLSGSPSSAPSIDPGTLMRLVSRNTKRGAQFTPQGILRWPLTSASAEEVARRNPNPPRFTHPSQSRVSLFKYALSLPPV